VANQALVTPDKISAEEIKRFELGGILPYQSKELFWRYIFSIQIAKLLLAYAKQRKPEPGRVTELEHHVRQFLVASGEAEDLSSLEQFWKIIEKIKLSLKLSPVKGAELSGDVELASGIHANEKIREIEAKLKQLAAELLPKTGDFAFHLLIDQVERIWSNDQSSDDLVIGLLLAAKHVQAAYSFIVCLVFLRIASER
jgi:hypothetical protein